MLRRSIPLDVLIGHGGKGLHGDISRRMGRIHRTEVLRSSLIRTFRMVGCRLMKLPLDYVAGHIVCRGRWLLPQKWCLNAANYISEGLRISRTSQYSNAQVSGSKREGCPGPLTLTSS
jgi:hypothetical protein